MTDLQAIEKRISRRSYSGALTKAQVLKLEELVATANLESGLSIRLLENGTEAFGGVSDTYGMFKGVRGLLVLAGRQSDPDLYEKAGRAGEHLVLEAVKMGLGTCWVAGTFDRARMARDLPQNQTLVAVITVGPVKESQGLVEKTVGRVAKRRAAKTEDICRVEGTAPDWFYAGAQAALAAPSAMNRKPVAFHYGMDGAVTARVPEDKSLNLVDLGIAKLHFEIGAGGRFAAGNGAAFTKD